MKNGPGSATFEVKACRYLPFLQCSTELLVAADAVIHISSIQTSQTVVILVCLLPNHMAEPVCMLIQTITSWQWLVAQDKESVMTAAGTQSTRPFQHHHKQTKQLQLKLWL